MSQDQELKHHPLREGYIALLESCKPAFHLTLVPDKAVSNVSEFSRYCNAVLKKLNRVLGEGFTGYSILEYQANRTDCNFPVPHFHLVLAWEYGSSVYDVNDVAATLIQDIIPSIFGPEPKKNGVITNKPRNRYFSMASWDIAEIFNAKSIADYLTKTMAKLDLVSERLRSSVIHPLRKDGLINHAHYTQIVREQRHELIRYAHLETPDTSLRTDTK